MSDNLDEILLNLILEAQKDPQRIRALNKLIREILKSERLCRPKCPPSLQNCYQEIYETAKQNLFMYICQRPENYDSSKGTVLQWVNGILRYRFIDAMREINPLPPEGYSILSLDNLEKDNFTKIPESEKPLSFSEQIVEIIKEDPEGIFQSTRISSISENPNSSWQYIALKKNAEGYTFTILANELKVSIACVNTFYRKYLKIFAPIIRNYLE